MTDEKLGPHGFLCECNPRERGTCTKKWLRCQAAVSDMCPGTLADPLTSKQAAKRRAAASGEVSP